MTEQRTKKDWAIFMQEVLEEHSPTASKVVVVMDNLNTHTPVSFYEVFPPEEAVCQCRVPLRDQDRCFAGGIEAVSPARCFVDGERTLVITAVEMTICPHVRSRIERIAQFRLQNDLNRLTLLCGDGQHASTLSIACAICRQQVTSKLCEQMDHIGKVMPGATSTFPNGEDYASQQ